MHLVGYLYEDYHDARLLEHKMRTYIGSVTCHTPTRVALCITEYGVQVQFYLASIQSCRKLLDILYH
jgi:hypothetical protein